MLVPDGYSIWKKRFDLPFLIRRTCYQVMYVRRCVLGTELLIIGDKSVILVIKTSVSILLVLFQKRESVIEGDFQNSHGRGLVPR